MVGSFIVHVAGQGRKKIYGVVTFQPFLGFKNDLFAHLLVFFNSKINGLKYMCLCSWDAYDDPLPLETSSSSNSR